MGACVGKSIPARHDTFKKVTIEQDVLVCNVCSLQYNLTDRIPMMVCINQHNICKICVQRFTHFIDPHCPFCRMNVLPANVNKNRILIEILQQKEPKQQSLKTLETEEERTDRLLSLCRQQNYQKVIYHIEKGSDPLTVRQLHLWSSKISNIINLDIFIHLTTLDLQKNSISNISNLEGLAQLAYLNLAYNKISAINHLESLAKLQFLDLSHNQISKIQNLQNLRKLNTLNLNNNQIALIQNLYRLQKLAIFYLKANPIDKNASKGSIDALKFRGIILEIS